MTIKNGLAILSAFVALSNIAATDGWKPKDGFIPNAATAIRVSEAVLDPIYGAETIKEEEPFTATLEANVWKVRGSLPKGYFGGVAEVWIAKEDGRILKVEHGK